MPHIVIVGAGFGGLSAARALRRAPVQVTVIDERNYHLFQPLLYQVATAALSPADIASPIRAILAGQKNARVLLGRATGIDAARREVVLADRRVPYDYLVVATGARHAYFGHDDWMIFAPGLKNLDDATQLRRKILLAFERAENEMSEDERHRLMTFVVIGGGPTGVELAGAIAELARYALAKDFRAIDPTMSRIVLVEAGPRILPSFPEKLSAAAQRALEKLGVEVRTGEAVTRLRRGRRDSRAARRIDSGTVVWAAGVAASPAAQWLGRRHDRAGRVEVEPDLTVPGHPEIFVDRRHGARRRRRMARRCPAWRRSPSSRGVTSARRSRARSCGQRAAEAVPLSRSRQSRHDRPDRRGRRFRLRPPRAAASPGCCGASRISIS